jgi:hypothetical protein
LASGRLSSSEGAVEYKYIHKDKAEEVVKVLYYGKVGVWEATAKCGCEGLIALMLI